MKFAKISDPTNLPALKQYAKDTNTKMLEVLSEHRNHNGNIAQTLGRCVETAEEKGCVEFCFHSIHEHYDLAKEEKCWEISLIGFIPISRFLNSNKWL
jgi:hypothetical protein